MKVRFLAIIVTLLMGCHQSNKMSFEPYHIDGRSKPKVAFLPINEEASKLNWSLGNEMISYFEDSLLQTSSLYISRKETSFLQFAALPSRNVLDPQNNLKKAFFPNEFLVFCDVIAHDFIPYAQIEHKIPATLKGKVVGEFRMKMRLQVIDIRFSKPKTILHEVLEENTLVDPLQATVDYDKVDLDSKAYKKSPMYSMHRELAQKIAARLDEYITIAKSRTFE